MPTCERTKAALIRRPGYPIGQPAPCFLRCCNNEIDAPTGEAIATCPTCGTRFNARGYVQPITVRVTYADGDEVITGINTTLEGAREYYLGKTFNVGIGPDDNMQQAIAVELIPTYAIGDKVLYRGLFAEHFNVRGIVECVDGDRFGIRLENGNFAWANASQVAAVESGVSQ